MEDGFVSATIQLQIGLNKRMYETGRIPYETYSRANEILLSRLTFASGNDKISHSERK